MSSEKYTAFFTCSVNHTHCLLYLFYLPYVLPFKPSLSTIFNAFQTCSVYCLLYFSDYYLFYLFFLLPFLPVLSIVFLTCSVYCLLYQFTLLPFVPVLTTAICTCSDYCHLYLFSLQPLIPVPSTAFGTSLTAICAASWAIIYVIIVA